MTDVATSPTITEVLARLEVVIAGRLDRVARAEAELAESTAERDALIVKLGELLPPLDVDAIIERGGALAAGPTDQRATTAPSAARPRTRAEAGRKSPAPAPAAAPAVRPPSTPDYPAIAEVCKNAAASGHSMVSALTAEFNVPATTAKNWIVRCRRDGLVPPSAATPTPPAPPPTKNDQEPASAVEEHSHGQSEAGASPDAAGERPGAAPATEPAAEVTPPPTNHDVPLPAMVFACEDPGCRYTSPHTVDGRADMRSHVDKQHHRRASTMELTPGLPD